MTELFPFGIAADGWPDGSKHRDAKEDRSVALIVATVLEQALESAIATKMPGLKPENWHYLFGDGGAPLSTFDGKVRVAFALGLYGEAVRADLSLMRHVRNTFAHTRGAISFDSPEIAEACSHFSLPGRKPAFVSASLDARETFIGVGCTYTIHLVPVQQTYEFDPVHASIMDTQHLP